MRVTVKGERAEICLQRLLKEFDSFITKKVELVGKEITQATIQKYRMCFSHLKDYLKREYPEGHAPLYYIWFSACRLMAVP